MELQKSSIEVWYLGGSMDGRWASIAASSVCNCEAPPKGEIHGGCDDGGLHRGCMYQKQLMVAYTAATLLLTLRCRTNEYKTMFLGRDFVIYAWRLCGGI